MATEINAAMRDSISALIQGLRIDQLAMIEAAGKMRYTDIASSYYRMAGTRERCVKELVALSSDIETCADSPFVQQMRALVASMNEASKDEEPYAVLGGTVRAEDAMLDQYKRAISYASGTPASRLLRRQYAELCKARARLVEMRDQHVPDNLHVAPLPGRTHSSRQPHTHTEPQL